MKEENDLSRTGDDLDAKKESTKSRNIFIMFGIFQSLGIGTFIFLLFRALNIINGMPVIGLDSQILLSVLIPIFIFNVEYYIYSKI